MECRLLFLLCVAGLLAGALPAGQEDRRGLVAAAAAAAAAGCLSCASLSAAAAAAGVVEAGTSAWAAAAACNILTAMTQCQACKTQVYVQLPQAQVQCVHDPEGLLSSSCCSRNYDQVHQRLI